MDENQVLTLTPVEEQIITDVIDNGVSVVNGYNIDELTSALLKTGNDTFNKLMNIVCRDAKIRKDIVAQINKSTQQAITSSDAMAQKALDTAKANSDAIRNLLKNGNLSPEEFRHCLSELRSYTQDMLQISAETKASHERMMEHQHQTAEAAAPKSSTGRDVALIAGGAIGGSALTVLILKLLKKLV